MTRDDRTLRPATFPLWDSFFLEEAGIVSAASPQVKNWGPPGSNSAEDRSFWLVNQSLKEEVMKAAFKKKKKKPRVNINPA